MQTQMSKELENSPMPNHQMQTTRISINGGAVQFVNRSDSDVWTFVNPTNAAATPTMRVAGAVTYDCDTFPLMRQPNGTCSIWCDLPTSTTFGRAARSW